MPANKFCPDNFRDVGEALVVQNTVGVLPIILDQLFHSKLTSVLFFVLQLL